MLLNREWATVQAEAELARRRVEETDPDAASLPDDLRVTVSIGFASMETAPSTALEMIEQADHALYVSKQRGRNQVTYYTPEIRDRYEAPARHNLEAAVRRLRRGLRRGVP